MTWPAGSTSGLKATGLMLACSLEQTAGCCIALWHQTRSGPLALPHVDGQVKTQLTWLCTGAELEQSPSSYGKGYWVQHMSARQHRMSPVCLLRQSEAHLTLHLLQCLRLSARLSHCWNGAPPTCCTPKRCATQRALHLLQPPYTFPPMPVYIRLVGPPAEQCC